MSHWAEKYVGLPYSEFDCAALCVKVCREQFNMDIGLPDNKPSTMYKQSKMITNLKDDFATQISIPQEGDGVLMIGRGRINHIGIVCFINNQLHILHAMRNVGMTVLHRIGSMRSIGLEIEGYYKWK